MAASMKDAEAAETAARAADTERAKTPEKAAAGRSRLLPFAVISITYLLFTVTDGAIRMIVLLHAYNTGYPWTFINLITAISPRPASPRTEQQLQSLLSITKYPSSALVLMHPQATPHACNF